MNDNEKILNFLKNNADTKFTISDIAINTGIYQQRVRSLLPKLLIDNEQLAILLHETPLKVMYVESTIKNISELEGGINT